MRWRLPRYDERSHITRAGAALAVPVVALALSYTLGALIAPTFEPPFIAAVAAVCWFSGPWYGVGATVLSAMMLEYFLVQPYSSLGAPVSSSGLCL